MACLHPVGIARAGARAAGEVSGVHFRVSFDPARGVFGVRRADGSSFLTGVTVAINLGDLKRTSADGTFDHASEVVPVDDDFGAGQRLVVSSRDRGRLLDLEIQVTLYDALPGIFVESFCQNVSRDPLIVKSLEPLRAVGSEDGALHVPDATGCLTNGEMYFDTGTVHRFDDAEGGIESGVLKGVTLANGPFPGPAKTIHSWWNAGLFSGHDREGVALGYVENDRTQGNLLFSRPSANLISVIADSVVAPEVVLRPDETLRSNRVVLLTAVTPYAALERYADVLGRANGARTRSIVNGWCSWFYTLSQVTEEEVLAQTTFAAEHLKPYGLEFIQVDEGYQRWHGDWEGNERFPRGMKWLADTIRSQGLRPGIWISPYVISEPTDVFQQHPEWLVKNPDGTPQRIGNWSPGFDPPDDEFPKRYCLDVTHPGAAQWLHNLVRMIAVDWGYEMIKIDFVAWSILAAKQFHDPTVSTAEAYRRGMEIMRRAAGDGCHILECGPGNTTVGLVDSMRIEADVNYGYEETAWETYFQHPASSMAAAARRYYFHGRTWVNDVDHLCMVHLDHQQSEAAATIIGMSGGNTMSGDRLSQLDPYQLEILKKILPASGLAARPIDLFDDEVASAFAVRVEKPFGTWTVAAFFNPSLTEAVERRFPLSRLWLSRERTYLAYDFWRQKLVGEIREELAVTVQPGSVTLLTLHEKGDEPFVLSTDRHLLQGYLELEDARWDEVAGHFHGISLGPRGTSHNVVVYLPEEHPWTWGGSARFRDFDSYTVKLVDEHLARVQVRFDEATRVEWQVSSVLE